MKQWVVNKRDLSAIKTIIEWWHYDLSMDDLEKVVAYKFEFVKFLQTYRLSLMVSKIDARDEKEERIYGNQIDILSQIMSDLRDNSEELLLGTKEKLEKKE